MPRYTATIKFDISTVSDARGRTQSGLPTRAPCTGVGLSLFWPPVFVDYCGWYQPLAIALTFSFHWS